MNRKWYGQLVPLTIIYAGLCLLFLVFAQPGWAAPLAQNTQTGADGQEYIVRPGDSLSAISTRFYGQSNAYSAIVEATNAKAENDARFTRITNPSRIQVGQRLWLPNSAELPLITQEIAQATPPQTTVISPTVAAPVTAADASVRFVSPGNGATVSPTFTVVMSATGLTVEPAGALNENAGHFHILVDTDFVEAGEVIINDAQHLHYGKGQFTTTLNLDPGEHVLRLQFANGAHIALAGPAYQDTITVTVAETMSAEPSVRFVTPLAGATVPPTFTVEMSATGLLVEPAGEIKEGAGHFHILVNTDFVPAGDVIINDDQHRHYGKGQYTTTLNLEPGEHVLRLQFTDGAHIALAGPTYQDTITVTVSADETAVASPQSRATPAVRFVTPLDGATVPTKFTVEMAATGLTVEPAGEIKEGAGHFHILVNTDFVEAGEVIINDPQHLHYGKGQSTTTLELPPGEHTLRLQFANGAHIALAGAAYRDEITVTVK